MEITGLQRPQCYNCKLNVCSQKRMKAEDLQEQRHQQAAMKMDFYTENNKLDTGVSAEELKKQLSWLQPGQGSFLQQPGEGMARTEVILYHPISLSRAVGRESLPGRRFPSGWELCGRGSGQVLSVLGRFCVNWSPLSCTLCHQYWCCYGLLSFLIAVSHYLIKNN